MLRHHGNIFAALLVATVALVAGCDVPDVTPPPPGQLLRAELPRVTELDLDPGSLASQVRANNDFAFELYHQLTADRDEGNLIFSPHSIENALAMTFAGARGDTAAGIADALNFQLEGEDLHAAFNAIDLALDARSAGATDDARPFRLRNVNQVFAQKDVSYEDAFLDVLAAHYDTGLSLYDFPEEHVQATEEINAWVEAATEERIKDLLASNSLDQSTRLVLVNAIYFNAAWASKFEEGATYDDVFHLNGGDEVSVPTMHQTLHTKFATNERYDAVSLPYDGDELSMLIIAPKGSFFDLESELDADLLEEAIAELGHSSEVSLALPKFKIESDRLSLTGPLSELGMAQAFDPGAADFSGMSEELVAEGNLYITDVVHKAFIDVDESGTEAAAATAVTVGTTSVSEPLHLNIDRPFIYAIRDDPTGQVLFLGRVLDPR